MSNKNFDPTVAIARLKKAGVHFFAGKTIEFKRGTIGLGMLSLIDFLCKHQGYTCRAKDVIDLTSHVEAA